MLIEITYTKMYNYEDIKADFLEWQGDHPLTFASLEEFIKDQFIDPSFDKGGEFAVAIVEEKEITNA